MGPRTLEAPARRAWPPLALSLLIVVSWAVVSAVDNVVYTQTTVLMFLLLIVTLGLQIFSGNSGVLSFGHVAFVAIGAYTSALLTIPPEIKEFTVPRDAGVPQVVGLPGRARGHRGDARWSRLRGCLRP